MNTIVKALRFVGDLDDDFYRDERQRDVWNEASAVGFQFAYWLALVAAAILPWAAGRTGAWIALGLLAGWLLTSVVVMGYAKAFDVNVYDSSRLTPRVVVAITVYLVAAVGVLAQLMMPPTADTATWAGGAAGALIGGGAAAMGVKLHQRNVARRDIKEELL
ncbi:preprotein translocase subunit Sec61beta [Rhodococcus sp. 27YEA15]|uniref:hypothetical protein n=1 Tax=Rhodococcus sp. 27YEA15 TaxID=3156259 RepID=UPI003C7E3C07